MNNEKLVADGPADGIATEHKADCPCMFQAENGGYRGEICSMNCGDCTCNKPVPVEPATPVQPVEGTEFALCVEHGFLDCSVCDEPLIPSPGNDGFRNWLDANSAGMEGEDDTEALMHVAWRAALLKSLKPSNWSEPC